MHGARMKNLARNVLGSPTDAEDAVQETVLISAAQHRELSRAIEFRDLDVSGSLINTCYDARRSRQCARRKSRTDDSEETPRIGGHAAPGAHPTLRMALERALGKLTRHQRDVFLLYEVEGFRHAEIAGMLEMTETGLEEHAFSGKEESSPNAWNRPEAGLGAAQTR